MDKSRIWLSVASLVVLSVVGLNPQNASADDQDKMGGAFAAEVSFEPTIASDWFYVSAKPNFSMMSVFEELFVATLPVGVGVKWHFSKINVTPYATTGVTLSYLSFLNRKDIPNMFDYALHGETGVQWDMYAGIGLSLGIVYFYALQKEGHNDLQYLASFYYDISELFRISLQANVGKGASYVGLVLGITPFSS